jgi:hypothetical protein
MPAPLEDIAAQFRAVSRQAADLVARVGESRITQRPAPGKWSIAECLIHLKMSQEAYFPIWRQSFRDARAQGRLSHGPFRKDLKGTVLAWYLEPPPKFRFKAPERFQPPQDLGPPRDILPAFLSSQDRLLELLAQADGLAIDRITIASPFDSRLHYTVWSSICVNAAHHRRHLTQAERVAEVLVPRSSA